MSYYFMIGMFLILSLNTLLTQVADHLLAGVVSVVGGGSALAVAWVKRRWVGSE